MNTCPRCNSEMPERPALSRTDNETLVCSECGILEAIENTQPFGVLPQILWFANKTKTKNRA